MRRRGRQLELSIRTWGGHRPGAGRKPTPGRRAGVPHRRRTSHDSRCPAHVTLRARPGLPSLRDARLFAAVRSAVGAASGTRFRVLQFSVQADHLHLLVEADGPEAIVRGLQGLMVRVARAVNRAIGRHGAVWGDRYHARTLTTPREMRNALVYVLNNFRKHVPGASGLDPRSSAGWFDGWRVTVARPLGPVPVAVPRTWLMRIGWRRHGPIDVDESPRSERGRRTSSRLLAAPLSP
jgi:putative transposase